MQHSAGHPPTGASGFANTTTATTATSGPGGGASAAGGRTPSATPHSTAPPPRGFKCATMHAKMVGRIASLLLWSKDATCHVVVCETGLRIHMTDPGKTMHATALIRDELFTELAVSKTAGTSGSICFGVNLGHILLSLGMLGPGPQLVPLAMRYPGPDGSLVVEIVDGDHSTSCALAAKTWDGETLDLGFSKYNVVVKATLKAELLKEVVTDLEHMDSDHVDIAYNADTQCLSFSGGNPCSGSVTIDVVPHVSNQLLQSIDVASSGSTTLSLPHMAQTIKTDYFKDIGSSKAVVTTDQVTLRINAMGTLCLLFHIRSHDTAATCGVECTILPLYRPHAENDSLQLTPLGL